MTQQQAQKSISCFLEDIENLPVSSDEGSLLMHSWRAYLDKMHKHTSDEILCDQGRPDQYRVLESSGTCMVVTNSLVFEADVIRVQNRTLASWFQHKYSTFRDCPAHFLRFRPMEMVVLLRVRDVFLKFAPNMGKFKELSTIPPNSKLLTGLVVYNDGTLEFETSEGKWASLEEDWFDNTNLDREWVPAAWHVRVKYMFGM